MSRQRRREPFVPGPLPLTRKRLEDDMVVETNPWSRLLFDDNLRHGGEIGRADGKHTKSGAWGSIVREMFADAYGIGNDKAEEGRSYQTWGQDVFKRVQNLPEWQEAIKHTEGDDVFAAHLAGKVADAIAPYIEPPDLSKPKDKPKPKQKPKGKPGNKPEPGDEQGEGEKGDGSENGDVPQPGTGQGEAMAADVGAALAEAQQEMGSAEDAVECMRGFGKGGDLTKKQQRDMKRQLVTFRNVKRIAELAGRMKQSARTAQREKHHGPSAIESVTTGGDLDRLLPSELMKLGDPVLGPMLWADVQDRVAWQFDVKAPESLEKGPIVFLLDMSGSMQDQREVYAKSFMLGMMEIAKKQKRAFACVEFKTTVTNTTLFKKPGSPDPVEIATLLNRRTGGGTSIGVALHAGRNLIKHEAAFKKADIVLLTDGEDWGMSWAAEVKLCHQMQTNLYYCGIALPHATPGLFDGYAYVSSQDIENNDAAPLENIFKI